VASRLSAGDCRLRGDEGFYAHDFGENGLQENAVTVSRFSGVIKRRWPFAHRHTFGRKPRVRLHGFAGHYGRSDICK